MNKTGTKNIRIMKQTALWREKNEQYIPAYVYWTVHHLDSWVKRNQLDVTCFIITLFSAQHVSDVNTSTLRSLRLIRWVISWVVSGSVCVGVPFQCGYGGVVSVCSVSVWVVLQTAYRYHTTIATLKRNANTHRTKYNPWNNYELVASSWGWMY